MFNGYDAGPYLVLGRMKDVYQGYSGRNCVRHSRYTTLSRRIEP